MAAVAFYVTQTAAVAPDWNAILQMNGTPPGAFECAYGYRTGNFAAGYWMSALGSIGMLSPGGSTTIYRTTPSWLDQTTGPRLGTNNILTSDAFRTPLLNGVFDAGSWNVTIALRPNITTSATLRVNTQMWRGPNSNGSGATKIGGVATGSAAVISSNATTSFSTASITVPQLTLANEYLFFEQEAYVSVPSSDASLSITYRAGDSAIATTNFTPATTLGDRIKVWSGSAWVQKPAKAWSGSAWATKPVRAWSGTAWVPPPTGIPPAGPTTSVLTSFAAGADRNDHDGSVGLRFEVSSSRSISWIGCRVATGNTGMHTVNLYDYNNNSTILASAQIEMTGKAVGSYAWAAVPAYTLTPGVTYALVKITSIGGPLWANAGNTTFAAPVTNVVAIYRSGSTGPFGGATANQQYVGLDLGW
jgi:hypothetical protein